MYLVVKVLMYYKNDIKKTKSAEQIKIYVKNLSLLKLSLEKAIYIQVMPEIRANFYR